MILNLDKSQELNIKVRRTTILGLLFRCKDNGVSVDLTNYRIDMHLKADTSQEIPDRIYNQTNGTIVTGNGYFTVKDPIILPDRLYYFDIRVVNTSLEIDYWIYGTVQIGNNVTELN
jgi:hypothetical protein